MPKPCQEKTRVEVEEFSRVPGVNMGPSTWTPLVHRLRTIFDGDPDLAGIVIVGVNTGNVNATQFFARDVATWEAGA